MKYSKRIYNSIKCLLGFHKWEKHIEWDNTYICVFCYKMKTRTDCCNAEIISDTKKEIRLCEKCMKRVD